MQHFTEQNQKHIFAISCSHSDENARNALRSHLLQLAIAAETKCWLKWILFFDAIYTKLPKTESSANGSSQLSIMKIGEAREIASQCGLTGDEDTMKALEFFHKQGLVLYFNEDNLRDTIFLNPKQLVEAFRTIITIKNNSPYPYYLNEIKKLNVCGRLSRETLKRIWDGQNYTEETQRYLRSLMIKFGLAVEESQSTSDLIIPCLVSNCFKCDSQKLKKWRYEVESIAPPLGFSSMVIVGLLQYKPPVWEVFKDGCFVLLHRLKLYVKANSPTVELFLSTPPSQKELNRMGVILTEAMRVIRTVQQSLNAVIQKNGDIQGDLEGQCFRCGDPVTIIDLNRLNPCYSQFCCIPCRIYLG